MEKVLKIDFNETPQRRVGVRSKRGKLQVILKLLIAVILSWAVVVLTVYSMDLPSQGGPDAFCESFYVAPANPSDPVYPFDNTFNISTPIDWRNSGGSNSLDKYR